MIEDIVVSDTNVFIDLFTVGLLDDFFRAEATGGNVASAVRHFAVRQRRTIFNNQNALAADRLDRIEQRSRLGQPPDPAPRYRDEEASRMDNGGVALRLLLPRALV